MDSINRNQPEDNHKDLSGTEAGKKMYELIKKAEVCFFCTASANTNPEASRPMAVQKVDEDGTCWFLSASDSHKNADIAQDSNVRLMFQGSSHSDFLVLFGEASVSRDQEKIKELWEPILKTWFTEGVDDPRITVLRVVPREGYYWDTKHGEMVAFAKQMIGAAIGKTLDDSIEGKLHV
jgi:general stress protein 26